MARRKKLIVAVWKEKLTHQKSRSAAAILAKKAGRDTWPFSIAIAPSPFSYVLVREILNGTTIKTAAQNMLWSAESGSFIGEITSAMLEEVGCDYVILGHSERRLHFAETDDMIAKKVLSAAEHRFIPILCFGDTAEQKERGQTREVVRQQLGASFERLGHLLDPERLMLAYEPVWAISTWRSSHPLPSGDEVADLHSYIREIVAGLVSSAFAEAISLLYGGSVSADNAYEYLEQEQVDGALVGGASKDPDSFLATLQEARRGILARRI